jgi:hypothetical protein
MLFRIMLDPGRAGPKALRRVLIPECDKRVKGVVGRQ